MTSGHAPFQRLATEIHQNCPVSSPGSCLDLLMKIPWASWAFTPTNPSCHRPSKPHTGRPWKPRGTCTDILSLNASSRDFLWKSIIMQRKFSCFLMRWVFGCMPIHLETYVRSSCLKSSMLPYPSKPMSGDCVGCVGVDSSQLVMSTAVGWRQWFKIATRCTSRHFCGTIGGNHDTCRCS